MAGKPRDLSAGNPYGSLEAIRIVRTVPHAIWECRCTCGHPACLRLVEVRGTLLTSGKKTSCGVARDPEPYKRARKRLGVRKRRRIAKAGAAARWAKRDVSPESSPSAQTPTAANSPS